MSNGFMGCSVANMELSCSVQFESVSEAAAAADENREDALQIRFRVVHSECSAAEERFTDAPRL